MFFAQMTSCVVCYDVIYLPFPIRSKYLLMSGVDSPECVKFLVVTESSLDTLSSVVHMQ